MAYLLINKTIKHREDKDEKKGKKSTKLREEFI